MPGPPGRKGRPMHEGLGHAEHRRLLARSRLPRRRPLASARGRPTRPLLRLGVHAPEKAEFLRLARLHREKSPALNPLDGREHGLGEVARWIGMTQLAIRFVGLGVILGASS